MPATFACGTDTHLRVVMIEICVEELALGLVEAFLVKDAVGLSFLDASTFWGLPLGEKLHILLVGWIFVAVGHLAGGIHQPIGLSDVLSRMLEGGVRVGLIVLVQFARAAIRRLSLRVHEGVFGYLREVGLVVVSRVGLRRHAK